MEGRAKELGRGAGAEAGRAFADCARRSRRHSPRLAEHRQQCPRCCGGRPNPQVIVARRLDEEGWVRVVVLDNGPGIRSPEMVDIFKPFVSTKGRAAPAWAWRSAARSCASTAATSSCKAKSASAASSPCACRSRARSARTQARRAVKPLSSPPPGSSHKRGMNHTLVLGASPPLKSVRLATKRPLCLAVRAIQRKLCHSCGAWRVYDFLGRTSHHPHGKSTMRLSQFLEERHVAFETVLHPPAFTAQKAGPVSAHPRPASDQERPPDDRQGLYPGHSAFDQPR